MWYVITIVLLGTMSAYRRGEGKSKGYFSAALYPSMVVSGIFLEQHAYMILLFSAMIPYGYLLGKMEAKGSTPE